MSTLYAGVPCQDPNPLLRACREANPPLPTDWYGTANLFRVPLGRGPGEGRIILTLDDLNSIDLTTDHDLTFLDDQGNERTLQKITLLRGYCLTPGYETDPAGKFLCEVVDRRYFLAKIPVDKGYNIAGADGTTYLASSENGGSPWTWQTLVQDLYTTLGLGSAPTLPYTYTANPENLLFFGVFAWEALNQVLDALGCTIKYDPVADSFSILKLGDTAATAATAAAAELAKLDNAAKRTWDGYWQEPYRGRLPEKVRVTFPRRPQPTDGTSIYYTVDVTLTPAVAGVQSGSYEIVHDGLTAVGAGTPTNAANLSTRASEVAARWRAKRVYSEARQTLVYRDFQDGPKLLCETTGAVAFDDRGGMMGTEVMSRPDGLMEKFRPYEQPLVLDNDTTTSTRQPRAGKLTETTGPYSIQPLTQSTGTWSNDGSVLTDKGYSVQIDATVFTPKPTANVLYFEESPGSGQYAVLPVQYADVTGGAAYPGFVSTSSQTWSGDKTIWGAVISGASAGGAAGLIRVYPGDGSGHNAALSDSSLSLITASGGVTLYTTTGNLAENCVVLQGDSSVILASGTTSYPNVVLMKTGGTKVYGVTGTFSNSTSTLHFTNGILTSITTP